MGFQQSEFMISFTEVTSIDNVQVQIYPFKCAFRLPTDEVTK